MGTRMAYALGIAPGGGGGAGPGLVEMLIPFAMVFAIIYFLMIRPQQKKQADLRKMLGDLEEGDRVLTSGGIHGVVTKLKDDVVWLQIAENVRIKVQRSAITARSGKEPVKRAKVEEVKEPAELPKRDYYEVLGVSVNASKAAIKKAFKRLARKFHPDVNPDNKSAEERLKEISEAYHDLMDPEKRKKQ